MTATRVEELAREEVRNSLPALERSNPSHFEGIVGILKNTIVDDYDLNIMNSEEHVRELITIDLKSLQEALK